MSLSRPVWLLCIHLSFSSCLVALYSPLVLLLSSCSVFLYFSSCPVALYSPLFLLIPVLLLCIHLSFSLFSDIPAGDGKNNNLFYSVLIFASGTLLQFKHFASQRIFTYYIHPLCLLFFDTFLALLHICFCGP